MSQLNYAIKYKNLMNWHITFHKIMKTKFLLSLTILLDQQYSKVVRFAERYILWQQIVGYFFLNSYKSKTMCSH